jgi:hypothetical protein
VRETAEFFINMLMSRSESFARVIGAPLRGIGL